MASTPITFAKPKPGPISHEQRRTHLHRRTSRACWLGHPSGAVPGSVTPTSLHDRAPSLTFQTPRRSTDFFAEREAGVCLSGCSEGWRHSRQQHLSRGFHPRQPHSPDQYHRRQLPDRCEAPALPRLLLHLSKACSSAHAGDLAADRPAGTDKPSLCSGQDCRNRDVPELQPAVRHTVSCRDADSTCTVQATTTTSLNSHVLPALIRKTADAIRTGSVLVTVWGSGTRAGELLYSDDLAQACVLSDDSRG